MRNARRELYQLRGPIIRDTKRGPETATLNGGEAYSCTRYSCIHLLNVGILNQPHRPNRHLLPERNLGNVFLATKDTLKLRPNLMLETGKRYLP
jgi:hypothetical protein